MLGTSSFSLWSILVHPMHLTMERITLIIAHNLYPRHFNKRDFLKLVNYIALRFSGHTMMWCKKLRLLSIKAHGCWTFPKCGVVLAYWAVTLSLGLLFAFPTEVLYPTLPLTLDFQAKNQPTLIATKCIVSNSELPQLSDLPMWGKELGPVYYYFIIFGEFSPNFENKKMVFFWIIITLATSKNWKQKTPLVRSFLIFLSIPPLFSFQCFSFCLFFFFPSFELLKKVEIFAPK